MAEEKIKMLKAIAQSCLGKPWSVGYVPVYPCSDLIWMFLCFSWGMCDAYGFPVAQG